jgi:FkbM family methyltransferase
MLDIGAHHGSSASPFTRKAWRVHCFEPDPSNRSKLENHLGGKDNVTIDPRAVGEVAEKGKAFFASDESTGISGMLEYRDSHEQVASVDVTTIEEITKERKLDHIDFLKIDVEGYDFSVLKGVPWDIIKPDVIECEFEDAKTKLLGHSWKDICEYLVEKGYTVYVSEWHPIIRYGIRHDWCGLKKYPCELEDANAWGNLLAFRKDPGAAAIQLALDKVLKVENPKIDASDKTTDEPPKTMNGRVLQAREPALTQPTSASSLAKPRPINRMKDHRMLPRFSSYAQFAEWVQSKNLTLFRIGQFVMWVLRFAKRHSAATAIGLALLFSLIVLPLSVAAITPYSSMLWGAAGMLLFAALSVMGVSFGNKKMMEFAEREFRYRQILKNQLQRDFQNRLKELTTRLESQGQQQKELMDRVGSQVQLQVELASAVDALKRQGELTTQVQEELATRLENQGQQQTELMDRVGSQEQLQEELASAVDALKRQGEETTQVQDELTTRLESQGQQQAEKHDALDRKVNRLVTAAPIFNFGEYQSFNRKLNREQMEVLQKEWSRKLSLTMKPKSLAYLAHRICTLESRSRGRLATTIEDVLLRVLVASAVKSNNLRVLEIGTLFGIGLAAIYDNTKTRFNSVHLTAIDPLNGYYGKDQRDIITEEVIDERVFRENLSAAGVPEQDWTLLQSMSTEDAAIESALKPLHDVLIIDGDHSYAGVKADFVNYLPAVKRGGYIIFDDYDAPDWPDVKTFVDTSVHEHPNLAFVGASWRTAVFRVVSKSAAKSPALTTSGRKRHASRKVHTDDFSD